MSQLSRGGVILWGTLAFMIIVLAGCFTMYGSDGGGQTSFTGPRSLQPQDIALPDGFAISVVASGLTYPTGVVFDEEGQVYVTEAGYSYGSEPLTPRLLRIEPDGSTTEIVRGENPPWNGVEFHEGAFYVAGGHVEPGRILKIEKDGTISTLLGGLPSRGDHHTNGPRVGPDGWLYFGQGTVTNSAVVGLDNFDFGWVEKHPDAHDVPCEDVVLVGKNYTTKDPREGRTGKTTTGAFVPFGTPTSEGQVVPGELPCSGAIMRIRPNGGEPELVAWGFRNPFGLSFTADGELYVSDNQYDVRGSRPVFGTGDLLWLVESDRWYGWPDFFAGRPLTDHDWFDPPGEPTPGFVLGEHPDDPPEPVAVLGVHSSSNGLDFSHSPAFGYEGQAFIAQFGDMAPGVGKVLDPVGYKVVRVDVRDGTITDFAVNRGENDGPASLLGTGGFERPVGVRFSPDGGSLYVVDFGVMTIGPDGPEPRPGTGVVWRIYRTDGGTP